MLTAGNACKPYQRVGVPGFGFACLLVGIACHGKIVLLQRLVALAEQHPIAAGIHQVLPFTDIGSVLILGPGGGEIGAGLLVAALTKQGHAQCSVKGRVIGVLLERTAQQTFSRHRVARLINHLLALGAGQPCRITEQVLLGLQIFVGFAKQWRGRVAAHKSLPGLGSGAINRQGVEVLVFAFGRCVAGQRVC